MITLYNNVAQIKNPAILEFLTSTATGFKFNTYVLINHFRQTHGDEKTANAIKKNPIIVFDAARQNTRCWVCRNIEETLVINDVSPIGLIDIVPQDMIDNARIIDRRTPPRLKPFNTDISLYGYQEDIIKEAIKLGRGIIKVPTGGGKTIMAIALTSMLGVKTTIVTPTKIIMLQFIEQFKKFGIEVGQFGNTKRIEKNITVSIINSIVDGSEESSAMLNNTELLILDEHHRYGSGDWFPKLMNCPAYYRIGQSATPWRANDFETLKLVALTGGYIGEITIQDLQSQGKLVDAEVIMYRLREHSFNINTNIMRWTDIRNKYLFKYLPRVDKIVNIATQLAEEKHKVLILCGWDDYAQILLARLPKETVYLKGGLTKKKMDEIKAQYEKGIIMVATTVADEGMDIPDINVLINAAGGKNVKTTQQRAGRALRTAPGKDKAIIIDFMDEYAGLLWHQSKQRKQAYEAAGLPVTII